VSKTNSNTSCAIIGGKQEVLFCVRNRSDGLVKSHNVSIFNAVIRLAQKTTNQRGNMKSVIKFLKKLEKNNNRDWFQANKPEYEAARDEFIGFVEKLIGGISKFDPEVIGVDPKKAVFRIYRDVRFS